ncbi:sugar phosphotransferase [Leptospira ognonensis]|uniref:Sugar phosphotransferase n=1 Tax=Leptospira ognonensis TaxID=2484945 RepID=A0A4R9K2E8_9LEPT|nr:sugar phosphotransferase [Leptospira ognonensis]TGL59351.1 sugar phosphotransferase [Leptospira ognonensis]
MEFAFSVILAILALISLILHATYVFGSFGIKDIPNERSLHSEITKKSGGMIFVPLFLFYLLVTYYLFPGAISNAFHLKLLILGSIFFCMVGFLDDLYHLSPNIRLLLEFVFCFGWILCLNPSISLLGHLIQNQIISILFCGFLLVFIVNLVNFMDGLDLYLVGTIFVTLIFWMIIFSPAFAPKGSYFLLLTLLLCALSGFAFFNYPKAKLFMGDSGSLVLGFLLVSFPLLVSKESDESFELLKLFFLFPVFWVDGILTIIIRMCQKKNLFLAHREHLYQLLTETWLGKSGTTLFVILANLPATIFYSLYKLKWIKNFPTETIFILFILSLYIAVYSLLRFALFYYRKNLA